MTGLTREELREALPKGGLFDGKEWLWSPRPFQLSGSERKKLEGLGHPLRRFQHACDEIYRRSGAGSLPKWISEYLDAGKPSWLIKHQRTPEQREVAPRVIRPDLLLTENGFSLTELDGVPGGIGLLAWLSEQYGKAGFDLLGGTQGMLEGFASLFENGAEILVSEESGDYRPEMEWLSEQLEGEWKVTSAEEWTGGERDLYRFFELFDWEAIPEVKKMAAEGNVTPPLKTHFEEKLWLALFWSPSLRKLWEQELRGSHLNRLRELIPFGWVVDPREIPPHAALPRLEVGSWDEVGGFSQSQRELVLKISGFSELAWGSKSVVVGHDSSSEEWKRALTRAQNDFPEHPWMVQEFSEARLVEHPYYDPDSGELKTMVGRARLCPYYFIDQNGKTTLGGCLATIVPADKKKIHGMRDGILVPCC